MSKGMSLYKDTGISLLMSPVMKCLYALSRYFRYCQMEQHWPNLPKCLKSNMTSSMVNQSFSSYLKTAHHTMMTRLSNVLRGKLPVKSGYIDMKQRMILLKQFLS